MLIRVILTCDVTGNEMAPRHLLLAILSATPESNSARFRADSTRHKFPRSPTQKVGFKNKPRKYAVWEFPMNNRLRIACTGLVLAATQAFPALADPITIIDHENRTVTLEKSADRIASIPIPVASTVIAIDGGIARLVGMNPMSKSAIMESVLGKIFPEAREIPSDITAPTFIPNVEELAATNPDLVIQWADRGPDLVDPITNAGLNALLISYGTQQKMQEYHSMIATAMGQPERADAINGWHETVAAEMAEKAKAIDPARRPKVLYLDRAVGTLAASGNQGNYNAWYIEELVGGLNASAEVVGRGTTISVEQIAEWNPDVILLNSFEPTLDLSRIYDDPILSLTKAAQNGKVYKPTFSK